MVIKHAQIAAKHLLVTCSLGKGDSIKGHLEKAYEIGYKDALQDLLEMLTNQKEQSAETDIEFLLVNL